MKPTNTIAQSPIPFLVLLGIAIVLFGLFGCEGRNRTEGTEGTYVEGVGTR